MSNKEVNTMKKYRLNADRKRTYIEIFAFTAITIFGGLMNTILGM